MLKVLIPLDGSEFSEAVVPFMQRLLQPEDCQISLLYVADIPEELTEYPKSSSPGSPSPFNLDFRHYPAATASQPDPGHLEQIWARHKEMALGVLAAAQRSLTHKGYTVTPEIRFGEAAQEIIDAVAQLQPELMIMATHGRSGVLRLLMGSVAENVLKQVHVPILMVKPRRELAGEKLTLSQAALI